VTTDRPRSRTRGREGTTSPSGARAGRRETMPPELADAPMLKISNLSEAKRELVLSAIVKADECEPHTCGVFQFKFSPQFLSTGEPDPFDAAIVWVAMHWPYDGDRQLAYFDWHIWSQWKGRIHTSPPDMQEIYCFATTRLLERLSQGDERRAKRGKVVQRILSGDELLEDMLEQHRYGLISGQVLLEALLYNLLAPEPVSMNKIKDRLCAELKSVHFQMEPQTMKNNDGPIAEFRPVQHLWAAYWYLRLCGKLPLSPGAVPLELLPAFLSVAESIRVSAERTRLPRSNYPLLKSGEALQIPGELKLPYVCDDLKIQDIARDLFRRHPL
jgi:hypothetical protein